MPIRPALQPLLVLSIFSFTTLAVVPAGAATSTTAKLLWTATGNDGNAGKATRYDVRRSTTPLTLANFALGDALPAPAPATAGTHESLQVVIPIAGTTYYFAIRAVDGSGNWSLLSNVVAYAAPVLGTRPDPILTASLSPTRPNPVSELANWTLVKPSEGEVVAEVFSVDGRRVAVLDPGPRDPGERTLSWNLRTSGGRTAAPGVYWLRVRLPERELMRQVVVTT